MSWRGFKKAVERLPENVKQKVGKKDDDETFAAHEFKLKAMESDIEKLLAQLKQFKVAVTTMMNHQNQVAVLLKENFERNGENDKALSSTNSRSGIDEYLKCINQLQDDMERNMMDLERRTVEPTAQVQALLKSVRKLLVKRSHKLLDVSRHNKDLVKVQAKPTRDAADEKRLFRYETASKEAQEEYDYINNLLMDELPLLWELKKEFLTPIFYAFYQTQSRFYSDYFSNMKNLTTVTSLDFNTSVMEGFDLRRSEFLPLMNSLEATTSSLARKSTLKARLTKKPTGSTYTSTSTNPVQEPSSSLNPDTKSTLEPPKGHQRASSNPPPYAASAQASSSKAGSTPNSPAKRPPPTVPPLKRARVLYDFVAQAEGDLTINENDIIDIIKKTENTEDWWTGRLRGKIGLFPGNYVELI